MFRRPSVAALLLVACGTSTLPVATPSDTPTPLATPTSVDIPPELLLPLTMLGPCQPVEDPQLDVDVPGLVLPPDAFLVEVKEQGGLTNVRGYVETTPIVFQLFHREHPDLEVLTVEDEVHEAETLYSDGEHRVFMKAAAVCELGSAFVAVVAPEIQADAVPTPSGSPSTSPSPARS